MVCLHEFELVDLAPSLPCVASFGVSQIMIVHSC